MTTKTKYKITCTGRHWLDEPGRVMKADPPPDHIQILRFIASQTTKEKKYISGQELKELNIEKPENEIQWLLLMGFIKEE